MKNGFLKIRLLGCLFGMMTLSPVMAQQGKSTSNNVEKNVTTEINLTPKFDEREIYLAGIATSNLGLDRKTLKKVGENNQEDNVLFVSDNGLICFFENNALGVVIKKGRLRYVTSDDVLAGKFSQLSGSEYIGILQEFVRGTADKNSTIYKAIFKNIGVKETRKTIVKSR